MKWASKTKLLWGTLLVLVFCAGFFSQWVVRQFFAYPSTLTESPLRLTGKYQLVSPLLTCGGTESTATSEYKTLESKINAVIAAKKTAGEATDISVYFRGFRGDWVGVNENEKYSPASLLKVPLMIAYYKIAQTNPSILSKQLLYDGSFDENKAETFRSQSDIVPGWYTIDNLIKSMIVNSDDNATLLLSREIDTNTLAAVYTDLGLSLPPDNSLAADLISVNQYSYFFRVLYNTTYLTPEYSEKALELLVGPDFPQGMRSAVPANIPIAQKFGERSVLTPTGSVIQRELHDCGIIYRSGSPYFLCIMTRGNDFKGLLDTIQSVTKVVDADVNSGK